MTPGNELRLKRIIARLKNAFKVSADAQGMALILLDIQADLNTVLLDLVLRPEVNS